MSQSIHNLPVFAWAWHPHTPETTIYDIMLTDDELAEREDWINHVASLDPENETFEADLYNWEESG